MVGAVRSIHIADVGDGICIGVRTLVGESVQIDCGSQQGGELAFEGLKRTLYGAGGRTVFILSHFHIDHYNGLLYASLSSDHWRKGLPTIREVYYPRIPDFKQRTEFLLCLLTMNSRIFGSETGVMECDFLNAISRINQGQSFDYRPVSQGDVIDVGNGVLDVLWPPLTMNDERVLAAVRRALKDFERAMEEDETTRRLYKRVARAGVFEEYFERHHRREKPITDIKEYVGQGLESRAKLPDTVRIANRSLRNAANHMGLALFEDSRFLFLGDVGGFEIKEIVNHLRSRKKRSFYVIISPHHGTRWDESLRQIHCFYSISSVGGKLVSKLDRRIGEISERSLATWVNGDIVLAMFPGGRIGSKFLWW
jgi:hypothetical protein